MLIGVDVDEYYTTFRGGQVGHSHMLLTSATKAVKVATERVFIEVCVVGIQL